MYAVLLIGVFGLLSFLYLTGVQEQMSEEEMNFFTCGRHLDDVTLSNQVVPLNYDLTFDVTSSSDKNVFSGTTLITSKVVYAFEKDPCISIHADSSLEIADVEVDNVPVAFSRGTGEILQIGPLKDVRRARDDLKIQIRYRGKTTPRYNKTASFGYLIAEDSQIDMVTGPAGARKLFPSFDVPNMLANYDVTFRLQHKHTSSSHAEISALSGSMKELSRSDESDRLEIQFQSEKPIATHQLISIIGSKTSSSSSSSSSRLQFYVAPELVVTESEITSIQTDAERALENVEKYLGISNNNNKINVVFVSELDSSSINTRGLCLIRIFDVLNEETRNNTLYEAFSSQAFSDITPMEWSSNWLLRSIASIVAENAASQTSRSTLMKTLENLDSDSYQASISLTLSPSTTFQIESLNSVETTDIKANAVLRMLFAIIDRESPNTSKQVLKDFLGTYSGTSVESRTFLKLVDQTRGDKKTTPSSTLFSRWCSAPGFPLVEITCDGTEKASATQERFFLSPESKALNKIQMNTHIPGYGIEYAKYWKEGWTVPIEILDNHVDVSIVSETPLGDTGYVSTSPNTCPSSHCMLGDACGLSPVWGSHDGIKVEPTLLVSEDTCLSNLNNLTSLAIEDRVSVLTGLLASAMSDERRDEKGTLDIVLNALFASWNSDDDVSDHLFMWNALIEKNYRLFALPEKRSMLVDHVNLVLSSDRFKDDFQFASNILFQFGNHNTASNILRLFSSSLAHTVVTTYQVLSSTATDSDVKSKLKSVLSVCLESTKNDLPTRAKCTQAAMFGLVSKSSATRLELVPKILMSFLPGDLEVACRVANFTTSNCPVLDDISSSFAEDTTGEIFRSAILAMGRTHNVEARVKSLEWFTEIAWPYLRERYGRNSRRLASYVTDLTFSVSSSEELEVLKQFEDQWNLGFVHSSDRVVTLALARAKERANAMIGWRSRLI
jgi:hypothetical protein